MKKLLLIDSNSLIHRSFHALPELTNAAGIPTGALYGLLMMTLKILDREKPDYVAAAFDRPEPTFRKKLDDTYKAHRPKAPDSLVAQIIKAREVFSAIGIRSFELPGYEADDIIGTFAEKFKNAVEVRILSGDLDSLQLVEDGRVTVITLRKGVTDIVEYDEKAVFERFGVGPKKLIDWKALVGDASDNISGVPGIGAKGALKLLSAHGGVEEILAAEENDPLIEKVKKYKKEALLSKTLATINKTVGLEPSLVDLAWDGIKTETIEPVLQELEFETLMKRFGVVKRAVLEKKTENKSPEAPSLFGEFTNKNNGSQKVFFFTTPEGAAEKIKKIGQASIKVGYDWKSLYKTSAEHGLYFAVDASFFDIMLAGWLLNPDAKDYSLESLYKREFKKTQKDGASAIKGLYPVFREKIDREGLKKLMSSFEMPLITLLADMELKGIGINKKKLSSLRIRVKKETDALTKDIYKLAGEEFNLNSPKQLGKILFEKLLISPGKKKKTKTGAPSTREGVLEELRGEHQIIPRVMEYRENAKILGTYIEPLISLEKNGRIHTTFLQTGTATGRLSSEKPNLQNIPQDSKWALAVRDCFESKKGYSLVAFDYSQLELRVLAHLSHDSGLLAAFNEGRDIHTITAQKIFKIKEVDHYRRRVAKTLNFGMVYGMGPRAFAQSAGVPQKEAEQYIREYFSEFPMVREWQGGQKNHAKRFGWIANENGRKRWFESFKNFSEVERAAINMPTQSVGADIMKSAIIAVGVFLKEFVEKKPAIILTIHDELIVEIQDDILNETASKIQKIMESCYPLSIRLRVDVSSGKTLGSMKPLLK